MCMCLARGGVDERIGFGLYQSCGNMGSVGRVCFGCSGVGGVRWGVGRGLGPGSVGVGWCHVCVRCESGFSV